MPETTQRIERAIAQWRNDYGESALQPVPSMCSVAQHNDEPHVVLRNTHGFLTAYRLNVANDTLHEMGTMDALRAFDPDEYKRLRAIGRKGK